MAIRALDPLVWHLRTESLFVHALHVHHTPPWRQARPARTPSERLSMPRCRCIACIRPRSCTPFDEIRLQPICLAGTCGPKASSCVCCTFTTLHHGAKHVHHALSAAVDAAVSLAYTQGHALRSCARLTMRRPTTTTGCASYRSGPMLHLLRLHLLPLLRRSLCRIAQMAVAAVLQDFVASSGVIRSL